MRLSDCIAPKFAPVHKSIKNYNHLHYWLCGGRGSTKSSFVSIEIVLEILRDPLANAVCFRKVGQTLQDSCYSQILWAIDKLELTHQFRAYKSPLCIIYKPTKQRILFKGMDDPRKMKSVKVRHGYLKVAWYEELDEFDGMEEIRKVNQSVIRGDGKFIIFYSYNPPQNQNNWVNTEKQIPMDSRIVHHSTYLDVPREWLGDLFIQEAEHLKRTNELAYDHEYMGKATGTGGTVFPNVRIEEITDEQIKTFDKHRQGIDWGYAVDPFVYTKAHFDTKRKRLYIYDEIYKVGLQNPVAVNLIRPKLVQRNTIIADNAEPKSIDEFRSYGILIEAAQKGKDSIRFGIKYLQRLEAIVIDSRRCPNTAREFINYELEKKKDGTWHDNYPDRNNHTIDSVRYSLERDALRKVSILEAIR